MAEHSDLLKKLAKIEALINGTDSPSEKNAAQEARERLKMKMETPGPPAEIIEFKLLTPDTWHAELLRAICRKHGVRPFRNPRQKHTTVMVHAERFHFENTVWPEYERYSRHFEDLVAEITGELIAKIYSAGGIDTVF